VDITKIDESTSTKTSLVTEHDTVVRLGGKSELESGNILVKIVELISISHISIRDYIQDKYI